MPKYRLGTTNGQQDKMDQLVAEAGINSGTWQRHALDNGGFSTLVRAVVAGRTIRIGKRVPTYEPSTGIYRFDVDFGMGLGAMIEEGRYDWSDPAFTPERFPINDRGLVEFEGKTFDHLGGISSDGVEEKIKDFDLERPWFPAPIAPLLGFGASFPNVQRQNPIVGLGSVTMMDGYHRVPFLSKYGSKRSLYLYILDVDWIRIFRFLGVRPVFAQAST